MTLLDWIIPARALHFDGNQPMTTEPYAWHVDSLRYAIAAVQREISRTFAPAWERLADTLRTVAELTAVVAEADDAERAEWRRRYLTEQEPM